MASFLSSNLSHEIEGGFVTFTVDAKVQFQPHELNHRWLFQIEFMEEDPVADDSLHMKRHYFVPDEDEVELSIDEEIAKHRINTEWGNEEIYANLRIIPLEAPPNFVADDTRTNTLDVEA